MYICEYLQATKEVLYSVAWARLRNHLTAISDIEDLGSTTEILKKYKMENKDKKIEKMRKSFTVYMYLTFSNSTKFSFFLSFSTYSRHLE